MKEKWIERIENLPGKKTVLYEEPMKKHTTFRIGGNAQVYVEPEISLVQDIIDICKEENVPYYIIGNGSNLLVSDKGLLGVVISFGNQANRIVVEDDVIVAEAGALLSKVASTALANSLSGMEFAAGIPGTIGGAVAMNAGAYGGEMKDILVEAKILTLDGRIETVPVEKMDLSYRHSLLTEQGGICLSAKLRLQQGDMDQILSRMNTLKEQRISKQPLNLPSAGSTFKRPEGYFAGKLIMDAGLRGYRVGGACVSEKHCGFVVNCEQATAMDVYTLMQDVKRIVYEKFGVCLEPEVKMLGEF